MTKRGGVEVVIPSFVQYVVTSTVLTGIVNSKTTQS